MCSILLMSGKVYFSTRYVVIQREAVRPSEESRAWGRKRRSTWAGRCRRGQQDVRRFLAYARNDNGAVSLRMSRKAYLNTQPCHSEGGRKAERRIPCVGRGAALDLGVRRCGQDKRVSRDSSLTLGMTVFRITLCAHKPISSKLKGIPLPAKMIHAPCLTGRQRYNKHPPAKRVVFHVRAKPSVLRGMRKRINMSANCVFCYLPPLKGLPSGIVNCSPNSSSFN